MKQPGTPGMEQPAAQEMKQPAAQEMEQPAAQEILARPRSQATVKTESPLGQGAKRKLPAARKETQRKITWILGNRRKKNPGKGQGKMPERVAGIA